MDCHCNILKRKVVNTLKKLEKSIANSSSKVNNLGICLYSDMACLWFEFNITKE